MTQLSIGLFVVVDTQEDAIRVFENFSRVAVGLSFDGLYASCSITSVDGEDG